MIPKVIHYCWFGGNPLPKLAKKCIRSWKKFCPDYKIVRWDESNYDISSAPLYVRQAYEAEKWAFVTDYVRLQVMFENGGIYMDTDVELIKPLDALLGHRAFFGFENSGFGDESYVATGLGFGAEKGTNVLWNMMEDYHDIPYVLEDGTADNTSCPVRNTKVLTKCGFVQNGQYQEIDGVAIYPKDVFCPICFHNGDRNFTEQTVSIHWYKASWFPRKEQRRLEQRWKRNRKAQRREYLRYLPNRILLNVLGEKRYEAIKNRFKRG